MRAAVTLLSPRPADCVTRRVFRKDHVRSDPLFNSRGDRQEDVAYGGLDHAPDRGGATRDGALMEQSGRKHRQMVAKARAAKAARSLATRRLQLHPIADDPRW
jgi:hypothetical protein